MVGLNLEGVFQPNDSMMAGLLVILLGDSLEPLLCLPWLCWGPWGQKVSQNINLLSLLSQSIHAMTTRRFLCFALEVFTGVSSRFALLLSEIPSLFILSWFIIYDGVSFLLCSSGDGAASDLQPLPSPVVISPGFLNWAVKGEIPRNLCVLQKGVNKLILVPSLLQCSKRRQWRIWGEWVLCCENDQCLDFCS